MIQGSAGPLAGVRVVEFAGIGPAPFAVMLLSDLGAEVLRIERAGAAGPDLPMLSRGRATLELDLKAADDGARAREYVDLADVLVEGFRPGVMERLGLGPEAFASSHPRLIYARMTGWGQQGPRAMQAGHDINYVALSGMLSLLSRDDRPPVPPLNLLGDYAGGSLYMVLGVLAALYERERSGRGQVIDAAVIDGCASLLTPILAMDRAGLLAPEPRRSMLSGAAPYYTTYRCADGAFFTVGALEPQFRTILAERLGLAPDDLDDRREGGQAALAALFLQHPASYWQNAFRGSDACAAPVLTVEQAARDEHNLARSAWAGPPEAPVPAAAPRLSRTPLRHHDHTDPKALAERWRSSPPPRSREF